MVYLFVYFSTRRAGAPSHDLGQRLRKAKAVFAAYVKICLRSYTRPPLGGSASAADFRGGSVDHLGAADRLGGSTGPMGGSTDPWPLAKGPWSRPEAGRAALKAGGAAHGAGGGGAQGGRLATTLGATALLKEDRRRAAVAAASERGVVALRFLGRTFQRRCSASSWRYFARAAPRRRHVGRMQRLVATRIGAMARVATRTACRGDSGSSQRRSAHSGARRGSCSGSSWSMQRRVRRMSWWADFENEVWRVQWLVAAMFVDDICEEDIPESTRFARYQPNYSTKLGPDATKFAPVPSNLDQ